ncbi:Chromatin assembly factor 1 complex p150 subunit N-terminal [Penicillium digitatum]|uniref:Uncharacterized protein n=3 Tax=Penicillium digitatum TaxID=36651 RepID=K9FZ89_PEND2|nr:hypothetical protein PDIP_79950 [Penicillium digitatum Pd1]EKV06370.1 hypothetical protein PDIP_79950 [Penicillium digitatum Pd1]EKV07988.1 hypothetical protein PDIG_70640 [Penicillium digitatum PHI26]QQK40621.1 Chromatin assembly factor 1 complex p150 subunit N-terminal [Penicillium digitatum]
MIDDNLPTFFLKNNSKQPQISTIYHSQHGNDPEPAYSLRTLDPASPTSQNCYGVALYDPYVTDIVYGEVAVAPDWTQPSMSADVIRANGGAVPPSEPILPTEFSIQLYNPDQEITVKYHAKTWNKPARWEFEMPQNSFRVPSASALDQTQIDPSIADVTPKLRFSWRKDGKLSKDLTCLLHGKTSKIPDTRTRSREPDITIALFQGLKELTLYEPNLYRVEMEDFKGLEIVLLLAAVAIRDIFFGPAKEAFHITPGGPNQARKQAGGPTATVAPAPPRDLRLDWKNPQARPPGAAMRGQSSPPRLNIPNSSSPAPQERWRQDELARQEEERRSQEVLAAQHEARRRREAEVEDETRRLQQLYGKEEEQARRPRHAPAPSSRPYPLPRHTGPPQPSSHQYSQSSVQLSPHSAGRPSHHSRQQHSHDAQAPAFANSPYLHAPDHMDPRAQSSTLLMQSQPQQARPQPRPQSTVGFHPTSSGALPAASRPHVQPKKSSFFGFRRNKEENSATKLEKKRSSMF